MSEPIIYEHGYGRGTERIVAIEYREEKLKEKTITVPFSVFTTSNEKPSEWMAGIYDFEWCNRDEFLYFHLSGGGGRFYVHKFCTPATANVKIWWDRTLVKPTNGGNCSRRPLSDETMRRFGYVIIDEPIELDCGWNKCFSPFEAANHGQTEYCSRCDDQIPDDSLCDHIWWCEKCGVFSTPQDRCKHRRVR